MRTDSTQWNRMAATWSHLGPPLRPSPEDLLHYREALALDGNWPHPLQVLVLGVTPEFHQLPWPKGSQISGCDRCGEMIEKIWPGPPDTVFRSDWLSIPCLGESFDAIVCDGGLNLLPGVRPQQQLAASVARLLKPEARFVLRAFTFPDRPETPDDIHADFMQGRITTFHMLKLRVAMSLQEVSGRTIPVAAVHDHILSRWGSVEAVARQGKWAVESVRTIETYRGSDSVYCYLSYSDILETFFTGGGLRPMFCRTATYPLGERFPTIGFVKSKAATRNS